LKRRQIREQRVSVKERGKENKGKDTKKRKNKRKHIEIRRRRG